MTLKTKHLFPFIRLVNKLDLKNDLKEFYSKKPDVTGLSDVEKKAAADERKIDFLFLFLEKAQMVEKEFLHFISLYTEKSIEDVNEMNFHEIVEVLKSIATDKNINVFFQQAVKSPTSNVST